LGFRHIGFKVTDLDDRVAALHDAGVVFHLEPFDASGGVRIAFFYDPDGVLLEFVQGDLQYHRVWDADLVAEERALTPPATPRFDHVAVTVPRLNETVAFYRDALGFALAGQLIRDDDPRGFAITYLHASGTVLEVFSYDADKEPTPWSPDSAQLGFHAVGFSDADVDALTARLKNAGATEIAREHDGLLLTDPDGFSATLASR
jgi:catechol 2,3-dioxygenase-like lactoylglutathione lyase family enzyme